MSARQMFVLDPSGFQLSVGELDLSNVANANAAAPLVAVITERCECCGQWREVGRLDLPTWDEKEPKL